mgnify:CR=1 FL=1
MTPLKSVAHVLLESDSFHFKNEASQMVLFSYDDRWLLSSLYDTSGVREGCINVIVST